MSEEVDEWLSDGRDCHFCVIASTAQPTPHPTIAASPSASAYLVLSTHAVVGFLELAPMSRGHIVLLPREHAGKISELSSDASAVLGYWLPILEYLAGEWQDGRSDDQACALPYHSAAAPGDEESLWGGAGSERDDDVREEAGASGGGAGYEDAG
ncbi:hypothetical protein V502_06020 [Pseudogymnoascus sp. VKM F-4520 (FW-2644)]|nr:hypothetical protein V502_06020 [Pseudogymnoascus sp. VKM F-4520 (FW-2644)]